MQIEAYRYTVNRDLILCPILGCYDFKVHAKMLRNLSQSHVFISQVADCRFTVTLYAMYY